MKTPGQTEFQMGAGAERTRRALLRQIAHAGAAAFVMPGVGVLGQAADSRNASPEAIANPVLSRLLPRPRRIEPASQGYVLPDDTSIVVIGPEPAKCRFIGERLSQMIEAEFGIRVAVRQRREAEGWRFSLGGEAPEVRNVDSQPASNQGRVVESYRLHVDGRGAHASANCAQGLLWAAMTFRQLLVKDGQTVVATGVRIEDWPRYRWRGFMVDSGRAPNSLPQLKRIVRICSAFKLNCVVFREGDDELAAVRYRANKLGRENPHALTIDEINEFVDYCDQYGIAVVPEIESLGHSTAKGFAYPGLVSGGFEQRYEGVGVHIRKSHLNPESPQTLELLESIYDEWLSLPHIPFVHLGLDEVRLPKEVQAQHLARLLPLFQCVATQHGRTVTPLVWADAPPTPKAYRDSVVRVLWEYGDGSEVSLTNQHLLNQHVDELCIADCPEKVFMAGGSGSKHMPYAKSDYPSAFRNLAAWATFGDARPNFVGLLAVQWHGNMLDLWLPDFLAAADVAWNPPAQAPEFTAQMNVIQANLSRVLDASHPRTEEVERPAWDGIWLKGQNWDKDILPARPVTK